MYHFVYGYMITQDDSSGDKVKQISLQNMASTPLTPLDQPISATEPKVKKQFKCYDMIQSDFLINILCQDITSSPTKVDSLKQETLWLVSIRKLKNNPSNDKFPTNMIFAKQIPSSPLLISATSAVSFLTSSSYITEETPSKDVTLVVISSRIVDLKIRDPALAEHSALLAVIDNSNLQNQASITFRNIKLPSDFKGVNHEITACQFIKNELFAGITSYLEVDTDDRKGKKIISNNLTVVKYTIELKKGSNNVSYDLTFKNESFIYLLNIELEAGKKADNLAGALMDATPIQSSKYIMLRITTYNKVYYVRLSSAYEKIAGQLPKYNGYASNRDNYFKLKVTLNIADNLESVNYKVISIKASCKKDDEDAYLRNTRIVYSSKNEWIQKEFLLVAITYSKVTGLSQVRRVISSTLNVESSCENIPYSKESPSYGSFAMYSNPQSVIMMNNGEMRLTNQKKNTRMIIDSPKLKYVDTEVDIQKTGLIATSEITFKLQIDGVALEGSETKINISKVNSAKAVTQFNSIEANKKVKAQKGERATLPIFADDFTHTYSEFSLKSEALDLQKSFILFNNLLEFKPAKKFSTNSDGSVPKIDIVYPVGVGSFLLTSNSEKIAKDYRLVSCKFDIFGMKSATFDKCEEISKNLKGKIPQGYTVYKVLNLINHVMIFMKDVVTKKNFKYTILSLKHSNLMPFEKELPGELMDVELLKDQMTIITVVNEKAGDKTSSLNRIAYSLNEVDMQKVVSAQTKILSVARGIRNVYADTMNNQGVFYLENVLDPKMVALKKVTNVLKPLDIENKNVPYINAFIELPATILFPVFCMAGDKLYSFQKNAANTSVQEIVSYHIRATPLSYREPSKMVLMEFKDFEDSQCLPLKSTFQVLHTTIGTEAKVKLATFKSKPMLNPLKQVHSISKSISNFKCDSTNDCFLKSSFENTSDLVLSLMFSSKDMESMNQILDSTPVVSSLIKLEVPEIYIQFKAELPDPIPSISLQAMKAGSTDSMTSLDYKVELASDPESPKPILAKTQFNRTEIKKGSNINLRDLIQYEGIVSKIEPATKINEAKYTFTPRQQAVSQEESFKSLALKNENEYYERLSSEESYLLIKKKGEDAYIIAKIDADEVEFFNRFTTTPALPFESIELIKTNQEKEVAIYEVGSSPKNTEFHIVQVENDSEKDLFKNQMILQKEGINIDTFRYGFKIPEGSRFYFRQSESVILMFIWDRTAQTVSMIEIVKGKVEANKYDFNKWVIMPKLQVEATQLPGSPQNLSIIPLKQQNAFILISGDSSSPVISITRIIYTPSNSKITPPILTSASTLSGVLNPASISKSYSRGVLGCSDREIVNQNVLLSCFVGDAGPIIDQIFFQVPITKEITNVDQFNEAILQDDSVKIAKPASHTAVEVILLRSMIAFKYKKFTSPLNYAKMSGRGALESKTSLVDGKCDYIIVLHNINPDTKKASHKPSTSYSCSRFGASLLKQPAFTIMGDEFLSSIVKKKTETPTRIRLLEDIKPEPKVEDLSKQSIASFRTSNETLTLLTDPEKVKVTIGGSEKEMYDWETLEFVLNAISETGQGPDNIQNSPPFKLGSVLKPTSSSGDGGKGGDSNGGGGTVDNGGKGSKTDTEEKGGFGIIGILMIVLVAILVLFIIVGVIVYCRKKRGFAGGEGGDNARYLRDVRSDTIQDLL